MLLGMSQSKLGEALGLTFQQVQKYEHGVNRITAGMLYQLSRTLDVPISFFFDCYDGPGAAPTQTAYDVGGDGESQISRREARLLRLWRSAPGSVAEEILGLLSTMAAANGAGADDEEAGDEEEDSLDDSGLLDDGFLGSSSQPKRRRRRRGAAWDPADIG